jgi:dihydrofolate reductase
MKTQYYTACSLDGFIAGPGDSLDWLFSLGDVAETSYPTFIKDVGALAMGIVDVRVDAEARPRTRGRSSRAVALHAADVGVHHAHAPRHPRRRHPLRARRRAPVHAAMVEPRRGKNVWLVGGGDLVGQFHDHGLLDELFVQFGSVTLGAGKPLLPRTIVDPPLKLLSVRAIGTGFAELHYEVQRRLKE